MNKEERIAYLKKEIFLLNMKDHWDAADFAWSQKAYEELRKLTTAEAEKPTSLYRHIKVKRGKQITIPAGNWYINGKSAKRNVHGMIK